MKKSLITEMLNEEDADGKPIPQLSLNYWDYLDPIYFASISYAGDGVLDTTEGTIVGGLLTVLAPDGNFEGYLTATGSESYAPAQLMFSHITESVTEAISKPIPTLTLGDWNKANGVYTASITYDGDGDLSTSKGAIVGNSLLVITNADGDFSGIVTASEGEIYAATALVFHRSIEEVETETTQKIKPNLSIKYWTVNPPACNAFIEYDGDGELSLSVTNAEGSTITYENTLIVNDVGDAIAYGIIRASETDTYEAAELAFCYNAALSAKTQPTLALEQWKINGDSFIAGITYDGDGYLYTTSGTIKDNILTVTSANGNFNGVITASEGRNFAATSLNFYYTTGTTGGGLSVIDWDNVFTDGAVSSTLDSDYIFADGAVSSTLDLDYIFEE